LDLAYPMMSWNLSFASNQLMDRMAVILFLDLKGLLHFVVILELWMALPFTIFKHLTHLLEHL